MALPDRFDQFDDCLLALPFIQTWSDCGLPGVRYWRMSAICGLHGTFWETWDRDPTDSPFLVCIHCTWAGVVKKCPVRSVLVMADGYVPPLE